MVSAIKVEVVSLLKALKLIVVYVVMFVVSYVLASSIVVPENETTQGLLRFWCNIRGGCVSSDIINSGALVIEQAISLAAFSIIVSTAVLAAEYRYFAAILGFVLIVLSGTTPPGALIGSVEWKLIVFLIGSMSLAYILGRAGVFRYIAVKILELTRGNAKLIVIFIGLLSWFLSIAVDEVTSIVYVVMIIMDIYKLTKHDIKPLIIYSVIATNTGSMALPVGNPIGIYLAFTAGLAVAEFVRKALLLSMLLLVVVTIVFLVLEKDYLRSLSKAVHKELVVGVSTVYRADRTAKLIRSARVGMLIVILFFITITLIDGISHMLEQLTNTSIDPHDLLTFIPYIYMVAAVPILYSSEELREALEKGVEWPTIIFFMALFMVGFSLTWSGIALKVAYGILLLSSVLGGSSTALLQLFLTSSAALSAVLDNLSVVVAFTNIAKPIAESMGPVGRALYWALLYGGVLGGNYTPIGSSANIVAVSMTEKTAPITWKDWLKLAALATSLEIVIASLWLAAMA